MMKLLEKLNYKGDSRIAIINADESFTGSLSEELKNVQVDADIDPRFPYNFVLIFVKSISEVNFLTPIVLHNLLADGILWFCFPKKTSKKRSSDLDRDHGWDALIDSGLQGVRLIAIDEDWSAMRFRNIKYIKKYKDQPKD